MATKSSGKKSLKSLFSRSDREEKDKEKDKEKDEDKPEKKFRFPRFRMKPRSGSEQQKSPGEKQQMLSGGEASKPAEDGELWTDSITPDTKRSSLYATTSRAKGKEFSYSELDLRKPKKFATFSFGFRKKKKKDEENLSSSTFGLHGAGIEEKDETPLDLSQMRLDQTSSKRFSMSQPELDSSNTFDIPSPPPVAKNQSQSDLRQAVRTDHDQPEPKESDETLRAPIASIPELQLDDSGSSAASANDLNTQNAPQRVQVDVSDQKAASSAEEILQESDKNQESSSVSSSLLKPEAQINLAETSFKPSATTSESKTDTFATKSASADSPATALRPSVENSDSEIDTFDAGSTSADSPATSFKPSAVTSESKTNVFDAGSTSADSPASTFKLSATTSESKTDAFAAESTSTDSPSLNFTSSLMNSDSKNNISAPDSPALIFKPSATSPDSKNDVFAPDSTSVHHEVSASQTDRSASETMKTSSENKVPDAVYGALYDSLFPKNFTSEVINSLLKPQPHIMSSFSRTPPQVHTEIRLLEAELVRTNTFSSPMSTPGSFASIDGSRFTSYQTNPACWLQKSPEIHHRSLRSALDSGSKAPSSDNVPYSELNSSVLRPNSPVPDSVTSPETDSRVSDSKRRVILVKESLADEEAAAAPGSSAKTTKSLELRIKTGEQMDVLDGPLSPAYLSVCSDEGSAAEIYYSAEEDHVSEDEEMFTVDVETETEKKRRVMFVKMKSEEEERGDPLQDWGTSEILRCRDAKTSSLEDKDEAKAAELLPDSGTKKVMFVKMKSEEDKSKTGQKEEVPEQDLGTFLRCSDVKKLESEDAKTMDKRELPEPEKKRVVFVKMKNEEDKIETQLRSQKVDLQVQEVKKSEWKKENEDAKTKFSVEKETKPLPETDMKKVVFVKMRSEEEKSEEEQQIRGQKPEKSEILEARDAKEKENEQKLVLESREEMDVLPETRINTVGIVKMQQEGDKNEMEQQIRGQTSEVSLQDLGKSEFLAGIDAKKTESEETSVVKSRKKTELLPEALVKSVVKMEKEEDKSEIQLQNLGKSLAGREETVAIESKKEMDELPEMEIKQQIRGQKSEVQLQILGKSEFLAGREETVAVGSKKEKKLLPEMEIKQQKSENLVQKARKSEFVAEIQETFAVENEKETKLLPETEIKQQVEGQKSENSDPNLGKSEFLAGREETFVVESMKETNLLPETEIKQHIMGHKSETQLQMSGKSEFVAGRQKTLAVSNKKETKLHPEMEIKQQKSENLVQKAGESEFFAQPQEGFVVEIRKEMKLLPETEIKQQINLHKSENPEQKSGLCEFVAAAGGRRQEELPAPPVQQVSTEQVCTEAPPPRPGEGPQVETEAHANGGKQEGRFETDSSSGGSQETSRGPEVTAGGEEGLRSERKTEGRSAGSSENCPTAQEEHGRNPQSSRTKPEEQPAANPRHPEEVQPAAGRYRSLQTPPVFPPVVEQESEDIMSLGYSSLSTKLSFKSSSLPREDESKQRFRKVSLVGDGDDTQDTVDFNKTESEPEFRWKNRFQGVTQFRVNRDEDFSGPPEALQHLSSSSYSSSSAEQHVTQSQERRSSEGREEPAGETGAPIEAAAQRISDRLETQQLPEEPEFSGVFKAMLVELVSDPAAPPSTPSASPEGQQQQEEGESPIQSDMDSLVDTLRSMGPSMRPRTTNLIRLAPPQLMSSLPPIVEDATSPVSGDAPDGKKIPNGLYTLPADLGLRAPRDSRSPLELMKQSQDQQLPGSRGLNLPLRGSTTNTLVLRKPSDSSHEDLQSAMLNGNGALPSSRLDNSVLFGSYRSSSIDQTLENGKAHRPIFRTSSLPETSLSNDRISVGSKDLGDPAGTRFERLAFLVNSLSPQSGSLTGAEDGGRMSRPPSLGIGSPPHSNSPTRLLSPTSSIDLHRAFGVQDSPLSLTTPIPQRSFSSDGPPGVQTSLFSNVHGGSQLQSQEPEPDRNLVSKYRAFPDAYLTKEKEHGKLNPRPGKMYIFDRPGMCGQRIEVGGDVVDATPWELQETISIRVVRGGWVLYEKPNFKGEKIALDEGDIELTYPYNLPEEELQNGQKEGGQPSGQPSGQPNGEPNGEAKDEQTEAKPARRFIIGSIRRAVRDYSVPEISLFPEENAEGKKVIFRDTSEDARIFGFPIKANSIIINAGLWLVYAQPFFQGVPRILEVGGYTNPAAWGVEQPYVASLHPLKVGEPRVENLSESKIVIYDKPYFSGKSRTISTNMRDFMTRTDRQQTAFMYSVGSLKVLGGIWVGYEKEGFRGNQYLLEEGEYHDWRVWGGIDAELRSVRLIRADLSDPLLVMFEQPEEQQDGVQDENTFEVTEAIPDVELFGYKTSTRSIHVLSGAWIAYSHVDFSGNQYILEKGVYNNCADWGSVDSRICSVQPILLAPNDSSKTRNEIILYSEPDFEGQCHVMDRNQEAVSEKVLTKSCRVLGGSWVLYDNKQFSGNMYVLSEGDYPSLSSMGCPMGCTIRSIKVIPMMFCLPSISLFGLECLEGREITTETEIVSLVEEGFNNHILSVKVNSGCWVICEHSNYRGRQFLLEPIEITNWPKFSSMQTIGSMYPIRQKHRLFRVKNKERGHFLSVQGGVEEMKSGRVVVTPEVEPMSDVWFYQDGLIKSKLSPTMSLQVVGNVEPGAKVVLWTETRQPVQMWTAQTRGLISSLTFPGVVLDVKGGKSYDKDHVVVLPEDEERPSQQWEIELL
uniref:Beta/gamma crystallin 'Greek key' domain-containing protein n=1 Tax=Amphiprion ocellaris TaxID=80972 RepID=A0A3Q1D297_AMPOC